MTPRTDSDRKIEKTCANCVSRFLCPNNYRVCDGWDDEGLFWGFIKLNFPLPEKSIDRQRMFIKSLQEENGGKEALKDGKGNND